MFAIVREPIDARALEASVRSGACGAVVTFCGVVRDRAGDGRAVRALSYEAYDEMVLAEFAAIGVRARERFGEVRLAIVHRVGRLSVGEIAVVVAAASAHRGVAFKVCESAIDELKTRAEIWKKEHYLEGDGEWLVNACGGHEEGST